jgi:rhomboid protease GluP
MSEAATPSQRSASVPIVHPYEGILAMCAVAAPKPWYPRLYAQSVGMPQGQLYIHIEHLWLDGLVEKAPGAPETGPGLTLTPTGREVLDDPEALHRLREGRPVVEGSQGGIVREVIRRKPRPTVTYALVAINLAVFSFGAWLAASNGVGVGAYLLGGWRMAFSIYKALGAVQGVDLLHGEWRRLGTACFVHVGLLNLAFAMYALYRIGGRVEQMWGRGRFLVLYIFAGVGGNCVSMALEPRWLEAGSWGALYGLIAAMAVWVLCNQRHLPRSVAKSMRNSLIIDIVLLLGFTLLPGINRWDDLGGALTGAAVALVLQVQRFGPSPFRWVVLLALVPLPWAGFAYIKHEQATNPEWAQAAGDQADDARAQEELHAFQAVYLKRIQIETRSALNVYQNAGVLDLAPEDRKPAMVVKVKRDVGEQRGLMKQLVADLTAAGPYKDQTTENARQKALKFAEAIEDLLTTAEKRLREGTPWTAEDQAKNQKMDDASKEWHKLLR